MCLYVLRAFVRKKRSSYRTVFKRIINANKLAMKFDAEFMKKLEYLSLVSRKVFKGQLLARKRSRHLGAGVEFADHRDYVFGDDLRNLDWNVFARLGNRLVKRFEEEEDLRVYFFLDCSRSMASGTPEKFSYAKEMTAALAYIALSDFDRVSVYPFADGVIDVLPLLKGKAQIVKVLHFLESCQTRGVDTNLEKVVDAFVRRRHRPGLAIIVSDFFDRNGFQTALDTLRYRNYDVRVVQLHDSLEAEPAFRGDVRMIDAETGNARNITVNESMLRRYHEKFNAFLENIRRYCAGQGVACTISRTDIPFDELVLRMMRDTAIVA